jgi:hypothetical protein
MAEQKATKRIEDVEVEKIHQFIINVGVPGMRGGSGADGHEGPEGPVGKALRFEDLTEEQKAELKGPKGDALRFEDLTEEQKEELRGPKGEDGKRGPKGESPVATKAQQMLFKLNRWCKSSDVDDVLCAIIEQTVSAKIGFKPLTIGAALLGQTEVLVNGEPHYKVKVVATDTEFEIQDNGKATITIPKLGEDNVALEYYDFAGEKVADSFVPGVITMQADEVYDNTVGVKFLRFGRKLVLKLNAYNETSFNWLGKWSKSEIDTLEMEADTPKFVKDLDRSTRNKYDGLTFVISKPENITFTVDYPQGTVVINTPTSTQAVDISGNYINWTGREYENSYL